MESVFAVRQQLSMTLDNLFNVGMVGLLLLFAGIGFQVVTLVVMHRRNRKNKVPKTVTIKGGLEVLREEKSADSHDEEEKGPVCPHVPSQPYPSKDLFLDVDISADCPPRDMARLISSVRPHRL